MIVIKQPVVTSINGKARLSADLLVDGNVRNLWFEVDQRYKEYLCYERSDAFVIGILMYAMRKNHDIVTEVPMTDRLCRQLTEQFLPALYKINKMGRTANHSGRWAVKIKAPLAPEIEHEVLEGVGSGVSCGVDSLHVFATHPEITHGCIWNVHGVVPEENKGQKDKAWRSMINRAEKFVKAIGIDLIVGDTNFDRGCLDGLLWDGMTTYGNLFCVLAMQKFWHKYYVASGYDILDFRMIGAPVSDPAHYEWVLFSILSMKNLLICMDGVAQNRVEKVADLVDYLPAQKFLNVCHEITEDGENCSHGCAKCMRTMLDLDANGSLDKFSSVFDVAYYRKNFHEYLAELYRGWLQKNSFALELKPYFCSRSIPMSIRIKAWRIVFRKAIKKILRGGRTRVGRFSSKG